MQILAASHQGAAPFIPLDTFTRPASHNSNPNTVWNIPPVCLGSGLSAPWPDINVNGSRLLRLNADAQETASVSDSYDVAKDFRPDVNLEIRTLDERGQKILAISRFEE
jgi:hypothetical protein